MPEPVTVALAPRKITIDLPGLTGDSPALPLVYTTAFLKDNAIAHIQSNTEYITTDSQAFTSST